MILVAEPRWVLDEIRRELYAGRPKSGDYVKHLSWYDKERRIQQAYKYGEMAKRSCRYNDDLFDLEKYKNLMIKHAGLTEDDLSPIDWETGRFKRIMTD